MAEEGKLQVGLLDLEEVDRMIESREWWIFVGNQDLVDLVEKECGMSFHTVMGPPPRQFRKLVDPPGARLLVLNFARKSELPWEKLSACMLKVGCQKEYAARPDEGRDVFVLFTREEWEKQ